MSNNDYIDGIIGLRIADNGGAPDHEEEEEDNGDGIDTNLMYEDKISDLRQTVMAQALTISTMDKRIITGVFNDRTRQNASMSKPYTMRHTMFPVINGRRESIQTDDDYNISTTSRGVSETSTPPASSYMNRNPTAVITSSITPKIFKNTSAISSRGYDNKLSLWGTGFESLIISCIKRYINTTGEVGHVVDETVTMKTYTKIVGELYHRAKYAELPAVQSNEVLLLSNVFKREEKDNIPESSAKTWVQLRNNAVSNSCMSIIESIFTAAKLVPEVMLHPISGLITVMD